MLYKSQVLSFVECRTSAIYHAPDTTLAPLNAVQTRVLRAINISSEEALLHFRLAPLETRRDIAMLGLVHRQVLGKGPKLLDSILRRAEPALSPPRTRLAANRHKLQLVEDLNGRHTDYLARSLLGAVWVYNLLPPRIVETSATVSELQTQCQMFVADAAAAGVPQWHLCLSPRVPRHCHRLTAALL